MPRITDAPFRTPEGGVLLWSLIGEYLRALLALRSLPAGGFASSLTESIPSASKSPPQIILLNERSQANISDLYILSVRNFSFFRHDIAFLFLI